MGHLTTKGEATNIIPFPNFLLALRILIYGVPLWLSGLRNQHSLCEDVSLTPGLSQQVKDLALL